MIAVTGANGLLGSFLMKKFFHEKQPAVGLVREQSDLSLVDDFKHHVTWRNGDLLNTASLEDALKDVTTVIHTAAMVSFNPREKEKMMEANVIGTRNVVNAALHLNIPRLIHVSSIAALGRVKNLDVVDETNKWVDSPLNSSYAISKYLAELEVFRGKEEGLQTLIVNPSVILAGANWNKSSAQLFKYVWNENKFLTDGALNVVDVRDVTEIIYRFLNFPFNGERFIVNGEMISFKDFFNKIALEFNKKAPSITLNKNLLKIISFMSFSPSFFSLLNSAINTMPFSTATPNNAMNPIPAEMLSDNDRS